MSVAEKIVQQIGAMAFAMLGAKDLRGAPEGLTFRIMSNPRDVSHVSIVLNGGTDEYSMAFVKVRGGKCVTRSNVDGVHAAELRRHIEDATGLLTSMTNAA